jgi:type IV pilus assembly protein PilE
MYIKKSIRSAAGFTLTELLVVLVIIGILVGLTVPKYMNTTTRAKATEAKLMLKEVYNLQKAYYLENDAYAPTLDATGFEQEPLKTEGGKARYKIALVEVGETGWKATAKAVVDFDKDGVFNVWSIDEKDDLKQEIAD